MQDIWLSAFGYTVTCRLSELSLKLNVTPDLIKDMALEALGQISNDVNLRLEDISILRGGFKAQFVPDSLAKDISILQMRSNAQLSAVTLDGARNWGGMFKKVRNYLGLFYLYVTENGELETTNVPRALETAQSATSSSLGVESVCRSVRLSPVRDRKRELYKTLFDEGMDDTERPVTTSKSSSEEREKATLKQKSKDAPINYRRSLIAMARGDEAYVPFGESGDVLTYNPSKISKRVEPGEYIPEYVPTGKEKKIMDANDAAKYVPSKISPNSASKSSSYIPKEAALKSQSRSSKATKGVTYKPSSKNALETNEYVPASITSQVSSGVSYKPSVKRPSRYCGLDERAISGDEVYEPTGVTDSKLQYRPSQVASSLSNQNVTSTDSSLQLRTVRRKRVENSPETADQQKRFRQSKAPAPDKCLMPDWMFDRMKENQDHINNLTYSEKEIVQLEAEISRIDSLKNLTESHIRYLFYKLEAEIISVAVGDPPRHRHDLFMNEQSAVLNNAIPIKAVTLNQLDLIKKLCLDHFNRKYGFQIFYVIQVLLPEVIIRLHMIVNGTTYEESDRQTDIGIANADQQQRPTDPVGICATIPKQPRRKSSEKTTELSWRSSSKRSN